MVVRQTVSAGMNESNWSCYQDVHSKKRNRLTAEHAHQRLYIYWNGRKLVKSGKFDAKGFELRESVQALHGIIAGATTSSVIDVSSDSNDSNDSSSSDADEVAGPTREKNDAPTNAQVTTSISQTTVGGTVSVVTNICPANSRRDGEDRRAGGSDSRGERKRRKRRRTKGISGKQPLIEDDGYDPEAVALAKALSVRDLRSSRKAVALRSAWEARHYEEARARGEGPA